MFKAGSKSDHYHSYVFYYIVVKSGESCSDGTQILGAFGVDISTSRPSGGVHRLVVTIIIFSHAREDASDHYKALEVAAMAQTSLLHYEAPCEDLARSSYGLDFIALTSPHRANLWSRLVQHLRSRSSTATTVCIPTRSSFIFGKLSEPHRCGWPTG